MTARAVVASPAARAAFAALFVVCVAGFLTVAARVDAFFADGPFLVELVFASTFGLPALTVAVFCRARWMWITCVAAWAVSVVLFTTSWHPREQFVVRLSSVKPGMTVDEVESVMGVYRRGTGKHFAVPPGPAPVALAAGEERPDAEELEARVAAAQAAYVDPEYPLGNERTHATGTMIYRWNDEDAAYNADWGIVTFEDGRVVGVMFSPD